MLVQGKYDAKAFLMEQMTRSQGLRLKRLSEEAYQPHNMIESCPLPKPRAASRCWRRRSSSRTPSRARGRRAWNVASAIRFFSPGKGRELMARKAEKRRYSRSAGSDVEREMRGYKKGTAKSGPGGRGGRVKSRKQAIAIGLSEARKKGKKVPKKASKRKTAKKATRKTAKKTSKKTSKRKSAKKSAKR